VKTITLLSQADVERIVREHFQAQGQTVHTVQVQVGMVTRGHGVSEHDAPAFRECVVEYEPAGPGVVERRDGFRFQWTTEDAAGA
jgi:hypothetical protein